MEKTKLLLNNVKGFLKKNWEGQAFRVMTPVQKEAIPYIIDGMDVIVESPTGTGKTLAYLLPLLNKIVEEEAHVQVLVLAPTRELVMQIQQEITKFTHGSAIRSSALIGGADIKRQIEKLKQHPHIIVGTPGRILELTAVNKLKLHHIKSIVIDEADQMLQLGFIDNVHAIIKKTLKERQLLFFSATIPLRIEELGAEMMKEPKVVRIEREKSAAMHVQHFYIVSEQRDKIDVLRKIAHLHGFQKAIIFVAETKKFEELTSKLQFKGLQLEYLHGESSKLEREKVIRRFREDQVPMLITTDVASRGMDFQDVSHVIHFDLPQEEEKYVHRSGRTGRMGKKGTVISIVTSNEVSRITSFAKKLGIQIRERRLYKGELAEVESNQKMASSFIDRQIGAKKAIKPTNRGNNFKGKNK